MNDMKRFRYNPSEDAIEEVSVDFEKVEAAHLPVIVDEKHILSPLTEKEKDEMIERELEEFKNNCKKKEE